ncbi:MAG: polyprenyl synthetase family protein [Candidatus Moraniibacteriota bacterium]
MRDAKEAFMLYSGTKTWNTFMEARELIRDFKAELDPHIAGFFSEKQAEADWQDPFIREALKDLRDIMLSGGKRLRAALFYHGYLGAGGTDREAILRASISVELIHAYLLVHDDIMDRDALRHGVPTLHERYRKLAEKRFPGHDAVHFGNSIALILGDMLSAFGNDVLFQAPFPKERVFAALSCLQNIVSHTVVGQARDVYMEYQGQATEEEILSMYENKTARYSIEGPLHLGLLLAGDDAALKELFSAYALPLGVSYQIQDDIIGSFGTVGEIGKPVGSDVKEGKMTLLVAKGLEMGDRTQKKRLQTILERGDALTESELEEFRSLLRESGAFAATLAIASEYAEKGRAVLPRLKERLVPESYRFLEALSEYIIERNV